MKYTIADADGIRNVDTAKHTPGPWEWSAAGAGYKATVTPPVDDPIRPWFTAIIDCEDDAVGEANARLIAAAPHLFALALEVEKRIADAKREYAIRGDSYSYSGMRAWLDLEPQTKAALAKVMGQS